MLDKDYLAVLIVGVTMFAVSFWITIDFCIYRRKRAIIRESKTYNFYKNDKSPRVVTPHIKSSNEQEKRKISSTKPKVNVSNTPKSKLLGFFSFIKRGKSANNLNVPIIKEEGVKEDDIISSRRSSISRSSTVPALSLTRNLNTSTTSSLNEADNELAMNLKSSHHSLDKTTLPTVINKRITSNTSNQAEVHGKAITNAGGRPILPPLKKKSSTKRSSTSSSIDTNDGNFSSDSTKSHTSESSGDRLTKPLLHKTSSSSHFKTECEKETGEDAQKPSVSNTAAKPTLIKRSSKNRIKPMDDGDEVFSIENTSNAKSSVHGKNSSVSKEETKVRARGKCSSDSMESEADKKPAKNMSSRSESMNKIKMQKF